VDRIILPVLHPAMNCRKKLLCNLPPLFTARCYAERSYATVCRLSVRRSVCQWRSGTVIT